jgi:YaiO family outer membrane protein
LLWSGRAPEAALVADGVNAADPNNPELPALRDAIHNAAPRAGASALNFSQSISAVSLRGRDETWFESVLAASAAVSGRMTLTGEVEQSYRSKVSDTRVSVRLDGKLDFGGVYVSGSVTPHADFREKWSLRAGGELQLSPIVTAILDARHADYGTANVTVVEPAVRLQTRSGGLSLTLRSINLWDETGKHRNGWSIRSDVEAGQGWRLFGGAATYPDTEAGVTRRVRGGYAGVVAPLSGRLTLRLVADHEHRVATYSRTGLAIGLGWRFGS